jgi:hypothetical protein
MANITVNTNATLLPGETISYRYQKMSTGVWSSWLTATTNPFTFTTTDPLYTNYTVETIKNCSASSMSLIESKATSFACPCNVVNVYNITPSACNPSTNQHSITFLVDYNCMKDDLGNTTAVFRVEVEGIVTFVNPDNAAGTQSITINNIPSSGKINTVSVTCVSN